MASAGEVGSAEEGPDGDGEIGIVESSSAPPGVQTGRGGGRSWKWFPEPDELIEMSDYMQRAEDFSRQMAEIYGEDLISVGLYGSAARGQYREGASDLNLLIVLREIDPARLRAGARSAAEWVAAGNPPPLLFSESEWLGSADVFPIEYADIAEAHVVLHGSDPFANVEVGWHHLRQMCEHEIKAKKIALRERYILTVGNSDALGALLTGSVSTFVALFRAMIRLSGSAPPAEPEQVVVALATTAGFDAEPFLRVLQARLSTDDFAPEADDSLVVGYLDGVTRASAWLDELSEPSTGSSDSFLP
ncbi:hypothetical protein BH23GEM6_BH23GEM6_07510 [soil metagenome]